MLLSPDKRVRNLSYVTFFIALGAGVFSASSFAALVENGGLETAEFSTSLAIGGLLGVVTSPYIGFLMDRSDVFRFALIGTLLQALSIVLYILLDSYPTFILAVSLFSISSQIGSVGRGSLIALATPKESRSMSRGYTFTMANLGITGGALLGSGLIALFPSQGAQLGILVDAALITVALILLSKYRGFSIKNSSSDAMKRHLSSKFLRASITLTRLILLSTIFILSTASSLVTVGFAAWLHSEHFSLSFIGIWSGLSTILIAAIHVLVSKFSEGAQAGRASAISGLIFSLSLIIFGVTFYLHIPFWIQIFVATLSAVAIGIAGSFSAASGWSMSYSLASEQTVSFNQGLFNAVFGLGAAAAAPVAVWASQSGLNWIGLGIAYAIAGLVGAISFKREYARVSKA